MKKVFVIPLVILLVFAFIFGGCSGDTTTSAPGTSAAQPAVTTKAALPLTTGAAPPPTTTKSVPVTSATQAAPKTTAPQPSTSTPASTGPISGGILREIKASGPSVLSYYPEMGPGEENGVQYAEEQLMQFGPDHLPHPRLAESETVAPDGTSVTYKIRPGIKFSDGTPCNAEAVAWNYQRAYESGKMQFKARVKGINVIDDLTMRIDITDYDSQMQYELGWIPIFSRVAWEKSGETDEARNAWARNNVVGTGPFMLKEYKKDDHMTWVRNPNYWQPGKPYLDGIEIKFIPDSVTAAAMMEAGQADFWEGGSITQWADLAKKGFVLQGSSGTPHTIYINNKDPDSPFTDLRVREAVEYALDRPAMAKALGQGYFAPLEYSIGPDMWGYDPNFKGREYNPQKSRQLLSDAGYPNGLKINLTALNTWSDYATAIKQYLDQGGFQVNIDIADAGRFYPMYWKLGGSGGWKDLLLFLQASSPNTFICLHRTFGPEPKTIINSYAEPPALTEYFYESRQFMTIEEQSKAADKIAKWFFDDCLVVPLWEPPSLYVIQPYVHTTYQFESVICRYTENEWMDPH
ncbi:MAG: hypothetical protein JXA46_11670 [Dehalococcoidales bacterium]|nr:hypothetical protein [Dehalococcoidales bacterium]